MTDFYDYNSDDENEYFSEFLYTIDYSESEINKYKDITEVEHEGYITQPEQNIFLFSVISWVKKIVYIINSILIFVGLIVGVFLFYFFIDKSYNFNYLGGSLVGFGISFTGFYGIYIIKDVYLILGNGEIKIVNKNICKNDSQVYQTEDLLRCEANIKKERPKGKAKKIEMLYLDLVLINEEKINIFKDDKIYYKDEELTFLLFSINNKIQSRNSLF